VLESMLLDMMAIHDWFPDWVIGVLLAFGGCTLSNFGTLSPSFKPHDSVVPDCVCRSSLLFLILSLIEPACCLSCGIVMAGINMFKLAHNRMAEEEKRMKEINEWGHGLDADGRRNLTSEQESEKKAAVESKTSNVCCHPIWVLGSVCVALGAILDLVSFAFASVSLLAPIGAMTLVVNLFMAPLCTC
jgi:hypothetical protein